MKAIKCNFKNVTEAERAKFKDYRGLLLVSVGGEPHEGDFFSATIDLVNDSFGSCIISLYDTLQRYTMALDRKEDPDFFRDIAAKEGDLWLERNGQYIEKLSIPKKVYRWDMWLNHPNYQAQKDKLTSLMQIDVSYQEAFDRTVNKYLDRYCKKLSEPLNFDRKRAEKICFDYALEESTVLCLWLELNCEFEIYVNFNNEAMEETRRRFIYAEHPNLLRPLKPGFGNARQLKPQKFKLLEKEAVTS